MTRIELKPFERRNHSESLSRVLIGDAYWTLIQMSILDPEWRARSDSGSRRHTGGD
jgi:hypothetical protein